MELLLMIVIVATILFVVMNTILLNIRRKRPGFKGWSNGSLFSAKSMAVAVVYCLGLSTVMVLTHRVIPRRSRVTVPIAIIVGLIAMVISGKIVARLTHATCPLPPPKSG